jgi:hypothetical protein
VGDCSGRPVRLGEEAERLVFVVADRFKRLIQVSPRVRIRFYCDFQGLRSVCDAIIAYDDASTDGTLDILRAHPKVALIVANGSWEEDIKARRLAEGRHRGLLLEIARTQFHFDWIFCFDADEHVTSNLRRFTRGLQPGNCDGIRVRLLLTLRTN